MSSPADIFALAQSTEILLRNKLISFDDACVIAKRLFSLGDTDTTVFTSTDLHFLPTKGDQFPFKVPAWTDGAIEPELDRYGKTVIEFVKSKPFPGQSIYDDNSDCWVVCAVRSCVLPTRSAPKEEPKKETVETPNAPETNPGANSKPRRGRPPKSNAEPTADKAPATEEKGDDEIPFK